ncbi:MAG: hypothetical protein ACRDRJ_48930, partial [Streptosporangiaceae bacterium]
LGPDDQLFVTVNLERIERGLRPAVVLTHSLDKVAQVGANADAEEGPVRLGLAGLIASDLGAELATVAGLASASPGRRDDAAHVLAALIRAKEAA